MKHQRRLWTLAAVIALLAPPGAPPLARAQDAPKETAPAASDEAAAKRDLYEKFRANLTTDSKTAYAAGKEYLSRYPKDDDAIARYIKKWTADYERLEKVNRQAALMADPKTAGEAFALGKQLLAEDPEDLATLIRTAQAGFSAVAAGSAALTDDAATLARQAIGKIEAGKTLVPGQPFAQKDEVLGGMHYALGYLALKSRPAEAADHLRRAVGYPGWERRDPQVYALLGYAYLAGDYEKQRADFDKQYAGKPQTPESKAALAQLDAILDRVIDAYARAIAVANASKDPARYGQQKTQWTAQLTDLYKFRNNKTEGMDALIAAVLSRPLPAPPAAPTAAPPAPGSDAAKP